MISQYNGNRGRNNKSNNRGGRRKVGFWASLPTYIKIAVGLAATMTIGLLILIIIKSVAGFGGDDNFSDSTYTDMYNNGIAYVDSSGNNVGDMLYTAPLMVNYMGTYNKDINSYTEKQWVDAISTFYKMYNPLLDSMPIYDPESQSIIKKNGDTVQEVPSSTVAGNVNDDSTIAASITLNSQYSGIAINETEQAMLLHLILLLPQYENGSVSIPQSFLKDINNIFMIHSSSVEEYDILVRSVEKTGYINVLNDSEAGYDIPSLDYGSVSIKDGQVANAQKGKSYPVTDLALTGNLKVCYKVEDSGNYLFTQAEYKDEVNKDKVRVANTSVYGVYDDYEDCIKGKYELSTVPRLGYSRTVNNGSSIDAGATTAADGKVTTNESFEITEIAAGQFIEANGVEIQKLSDNQEMADIEEA